MAKSAVRMLAQGGWHTGNGERRCTGRKRTPPFYDFTSGRVEVDVRELSTGGSFFERARGDGISPGPSIVRQITTARR